MPQPRKSAQASKMYALYQEGYSLGQVAQVWGLTRQSIYSMLKRHGYQLRERKLLPTITFLGEAYAPDPDGYFRKTSGDRIWLHHAVWRHHFGAIPNGKEIHHRDVDKSNNAPENLLAVTPAEHGLIHKPFLDIPEKHCLYCNVVLARKQQPSGRLEVPAELTRRLYCNSKCQSLHRRGKPKTWGPRHEKTNTL